jgi:hypothetical protein
VEKRGLTVALDANGVTPEMTVGFGDEMQVSLHGNLSRVLAPRGIAVTQPVQGERESVYLALCVDGRQGTLGWEWLVSMDHREIVVGVHAWQAAGFDAVVWDNASSHGHEGVAAVGLPLITQPPYSPELNPAERVFEELRRVLKGTTFPRLEEKVLLVENTLRRWAADPAFIKRLCGWAWIVEAMDAWKTTTLNKTARRAA